MRCLDVRRRLGSVSARSLLLALFAALLGCLTITAIAQAPAPLAIPNVPLLFDGSVKAVARFSDGSVVIGGDFSYVNSTPRSNIAKLLSNGSVDATWNPGADGEVSVLAIDGDGHVYAAGSFTTIGGQARNGLAKLSGSGTGAADAAWNPSPSGGGARISVLAVDGSHVFAGGDFTSIGGQTRLNLAKLSRGGTGTADAVWNPAPQGPVNSLAIDGNGNVFVSQQFLGDIGGQPERFLAKVSSSGTGAADMIWNPAPNVPVDVIAVDGGGRVFAGGLFTSIGGQERHGLAKLSNGGTGAADADWNPGLAGSSVSALVTDGNGNLFVGGAFSSVGGQGRDDLAKLSGSGSGAVDPSWNPSTDGVVFALSVDGSGKAYVGGVFSMLGGSSSSGFAVLSPAATVSVTAVAGKALGAAKAIVRQPNGGLIVGGSFDWAGKVPRNNLLRLHPDGTLDQDWDPSPNDEVTSLAVDGNGTVFVGGDFSTIGGEDRLRLAKLSGSGTGVADPQWNPSPDLSVTGLAVDGLGSVYVIGWFFNISGQPRDSIAKLAGSGTGVADATWDPSPNNLVTTLAVDGNGDVYVGGSFISIGGQSRVCIAKLSGSTGAADPVWNPSPNERVLALAVDTSGNVYASGLFTSIGGQSRNFLAKLAGSGTGVADAAWNPTADVPPLELAANGSGDVFASGVFTSIGGQSRRGLAKLSGTGTGAADVSWNPSPNTAEDEWISLHMGPGDVVYAGGYFSSIGAQARGGLAALPSINPVVFANGFE
jgi:hypothetical protein